MVGIKAPGPRGDTLLGSTLDFKDSPLEFCTYVSRAYGDVARFRVGPTDWYLLTHPDHVWDVMTTQADVFLKPRIAHRLWREFLGHGLLTSEGTEWRRQNTMMKPTMHRTNLDGYADVMVAYTHRMVDAWSDGERRNIHRDMTGLTLQIVAKTLFDADVAGDAKTVGDAMEVLQQVMVEHIHLPIPLPSWWPSEGNRKKLEAVHTIRSIVGRLIEERRGNTEGRTDLLSMLMDARDMDGGAMSDQEVYDQAVTLFFAGHETTANGLTWAWYALARHPEVLAKLQAELDAVVGDRPLRMSDLKDLPYLDMVVHECLRYLPPVWVYIKEPTQDAVVGGYRVPKGVPVLISPWVTHHDPRFWPEPDRFLPERFTREGRMAQLRGAWIPFSGGARVCFGKSFALTELRLIIGSMCQRLDPTVPADHWPTKVAELSMHPRGGMPFDVVFRKPSPQTAVAK
ncbi:MAG: cytochrome P450 [Alphaproteobacteria bacterium]|nr:cytochrome P450 [Alphaproteobacteria bacterium]